MRDFLVALKEFAGKDEDSLYHGEREIALKEAQEKEDIRKQAIPGLARQEAFETHNGHAKLDDEEEDDL
jgi:hypothetical protein